MIHTHLSTSARYAVIHVQYADKKISLEECTSFNYAEKIIISDLIDKYLESGYFVVRNDANKEWIVLNNLTQAVAILCIIAILRKEK